MENQTHAQNQRVPVIQVSGLKKQYKLCLLYTSDAADE